MKATEFNNKKVEMIELIKKAQAIAIELAKEEEDRCAYSSEMSMKCITDNLEEEYKMHFVANIESSKNSNRLDVTSKQLGYELERIGEVCR